MAAPTADEAKARREAHEAYRALPEVQEAREYAEAFAWKHNLKFDCEGISKMLKDFHHPLPECTVPTG